MNEDRWRYLRPSILKFQQQRVLRELGLRRRRVSLYGEFAYEDVAELIAIADDYRRLQVAFNRLQVVAKAASAVFDNYDTIQYGDIDRAYAAEKATEGLIERLGDALAAALNPSSPNPEADPS